MGGFNLKTTYQHSLLDYDLCGLGGPPAFAKPKDANERALLAPAAVPPTSASRSSSRSTVVVVVEVVVK